MGLSFVIRWQGSVFPKALMWAIPNAILAITLRLSFEREKEEGQPLNMDGVTLLWSGYTSVLGFLVVFRNNQAYTRFWEGATLINQVRGEWFNAVSTLFAFCNHGEGFQPQVEAFQNTLVRLASMLYCSALQQVCDLEDDTLEIIENAGMDPESLFFMQECNDRCEIILQWIQRLIVDSEEAKTLKIAPPLLTRAFQELSRGIVNLNNARKIKDIPFPFPYAQMITCMLLVHWLVTPLLASQLIESLPIAGVLCFFVTFSFWCLIYIALEIDQPFGEDANDLPLREMQRDFNQSMLNLMHPLAQKVPTITVHDRDSMRAIASSDSALPTVRSSFRGLSGDSSESITNSVVVSGAMSLRKPEASKGSKSSAFFRKPDPLPPTPEPATNNTILQRREDILQDNPPIKREMLDRPEDLVLPLEPQVHPLPETGAGMYLSTSGEATGHSGWRSPCRGASPRSEEARAAIVQESDVGLLQQVEGPEDDRGDRREALPRRCLM